MSAMVRSSMLAATLLAAQLAPGLLAAQSRVVRAVLFFSPTCPHCHEVINQDLPIFFQVHGGEPRFWTDESQPERERALYLLHNAELEILLVDATRPVGGELYEASMVSHPVGEGRLGVPRMIMGNTVLVGSVEIPSEFHRLYAEAESNGAVEWPAIEGLAALVAGLPVAAGGRAGEAGTTEGGQAVEEAVGADTVGGGQGGQGGRAVGADTTEGGQAVEAVGADTAGGGQGGRAVGVDTAAALSPFQAIAQRPTSVGERFRQDPLGNGLAVVVLALMLASVAAVLRGVGAGQVVRPGTGIPLLAMIGIGVAAYLTWVETTGAVAVCGPVGDCNAVQQSSYARLFGVLPVGVLGLAGYVAMIGTWLLARREGVAADGARIALLAMTFLGTLFSIYLTFLEPFVIGATCAWCLASAVVVTLLLWLTAGPGVAAWRRLRAVKP